MLFKEKNLALEFETRPKALKAIALDIDNYCQKNFNIEICVTRILEPVPGEMTLVHEAGHAIDFRDQHGNGFLFTGDQSDALLAYTNQKYPRADGHFTLIHHQIPGGMKHFHLQIPAPWATADQITPRAPKVPDLLPA